MRKIFSTLRGRLILLIVLTSIPSFFLLLRSSYDQRALAKNSAQNEVIHLSHVATNMQSVLVESAENFLMMLAHTPTVVEGDQEGCQNIFSHLVSEHFKFYSSFYVADLAGNILCSPPGKHAPPDFENCDHFQNLIVSDDFTFSGYHICRQTGKSVLSIGYPIFDKGERVLVANVSLDLNWFYDFAAESDLPEGAELIVLDEQGTILMHYPENDHWRGFSVPKYTALFKVFEDKQGVTIGEGLNGVETIYAVSSMSDTKQKLIVAMGMPTKLAFAAANLTLKRDITIFLIVMVIVIISMWFLGDALIVKQAQILVRATRLLGQGDLTARTGLNYSHGELGQLAQSFDNMAEDLATRDALRTRNEAALNTYAKNLEKSNQELRDFANIASHDLQEPLRKIQTFGDLLQERCFKVLNDQGQDYVRRMQDAAARMQILVTELLAYSRVSNALLPFTRVDMTKVTQQVLEDLDWQIESKKAEITLSELPLIEADLMQMNHLMQNLIGNALKFHHPGVPPKITIRSNNTSSEKLNKGMCEIQVIDQGVGFNEKYLDKIFQPFQRLNGRNEYEGTGMGLAICRKIVERHGGSISAHSTPGKGSTFTVRLPLKQPEERADKK